MQNTFMAVKKNLIYKSANYYKLFFKGPKLSNQFFVNWLSILELQGSQQEGT